MENTSAGNPKRHTHSKSIMKNIWHKDTTTPSVMESDYETETSLESSDTSYSYETSDDEDERPNSGFDGDPERERKARGYSIVFIIMYALFAL